jgi:hypothetical protein
VQARGVTDQEKESVAKVMKTIRILDSKHVNAVTPIVFHLEQSRQLEQLLDPARVVSFNLDGTGRPQRYPWVRSDTAILVWDPKHQGHITGGHQLFGSVTFNMFWSDGYRAMDALDDNRDGKLSGAELTGLAVWFDRSQDGVSQAGEVVPIECTGVREMSVRPTHRDVESLGNSTGLIRNDSAVLPTYDWFTRSLQRTGGTP